LFELCDGFDDFELSEDSSARAFVCAGVLVVFFRKILILMPAFSFAIPPELLLCS